MEPTHIYYDTHCINDDVQPKQLKFTDIRTSPILDNANEYYCSVVRFSLMTANSLPLWKPQIYVDSTSTDINKTVYSFTLTYTPTTTTTTTTTTPVTATSGQVYVIHVPEDKSISPPSQITDISQTYTNYYYIKSFTHMIDTFNTALQTAYNNLVVDATSKNITIPSNYAPFMEWDLSNSKIILNAEINGYDTTNTNYISIFCNTPCFTLMSGFSHNYYGTSTDGKNYQFMINKQRNNLNVIKFTNYSCIQLYQEYSSATVLSPINSIVFITNLLPVYNTVSGLPTVFNKSSNFMTSSNNITPILTDFIVDNSDGYSYSGNVVYTPSSEYRLFDLISNSKISNFDLSVFWSDKYNNIHPIMLSPGAYCSVKLMFRKKDFN